MFGGTIRRLARSEAADQTGEPVPERLWAPRNLDWCHRVSFLLTTLLLLRCGAAYAAQPIISEERRDRPGDRGAEGQQKTAVTETPARAHPS